MLFRSHSLSVLFAGLLGLIVVGCSETESPAITATEPETVAPEATLGEPAASPEGAMEEAATETNNLTLTPENTTIQFIGTHANKEKPEPRTGHFEKFQGEAVVKDSVLKSVRVDIVTESLTTDIEKLTNHLKSPDFFNVNEHPQATFVSTAVKPGEDGMVTVTGDLTLLGVTKPVSFPAKVSTADGLKLDAEFNIDRTQFGMDYGVEQVEKKVAMTIRVDG